MSNQKCENCGAQLAVGSDGRLGACPYCQTRASGAIDPAALAATLGREMADVHKFADHLATTLAAAFPDHVEVEKSGLFTKHVSKIEVTTKQMVYRLELHGGHITAHRTHAVHGISLKNEAVPVARWLEELSQALSAMAQESQDAHRALSRALG